MADVSESLIKPECEKEKNSAAAATADVYNPDVVCLGQMKKPLITALQQLGSGQWMTSPVPA